MEAEPPKRKRGRPKGSRNAPLMAREILTPPSDKPGADYSHADIDTIVARQLSMLDWAQQACRNEMMRAYQGKGLSIQTADLERLMTLSNAIVRTVDGLKKTTELAEEIARRLSPEQLFRAALDKIKGQDRATLRSAIKELRTYLAKLGTVSRGDQWAMGETNPNGPLTAVDAIASLEDDE